MADIIFDYSHENNFQFLAAMSNKDVTVHAIYFYDDATCLFRYLIDRFANLMTRPFEFLKNPKRKSSLYQVPGGGFRRRTRRRGRANCCYVSRSRIAAEKHTIIKTRKGVSAGRPAKRY